MYDNGFFMQLMGWIEGILEFLRYGFKNGSLDINVLFEGGVSIGVVDKDKVIEEIDKLIVWQEVRKKWYYDKIRQKMVVEGGGLGMVDGVLMVFKLSDFGLNEDDLEDMVYDDDLELEVELEIEDEMDLIEVERRRRVRRQDWLRRNVGELEKFQVEEVYKLKENFLVMLRMVFVEQDEVVVFLGRRGVGMCSWGYGIWEGRCYYGYLDWFLGGYEVRWSIQRGDRWDFCYSVKRFVVEGKVIGG